MIDGKIYHGSVKEKEEAQQQYHAAKKLGQSAGQIKAYVVILLAYLKVSAFSTHTYCIGSQLD